VLNQHTSAVLSQVADKCTFGAYSSIDQWTIASEEAAFVEKSHCALIGVILYGQEIHADEIGNILTDRGVYLQDPDYFAPGLKYINPHILALGTSSSESRLLCETPADIVTPSLEYIEFDQRDKMEASDRKEIISQAVLKQKISTAFQTTTRAYNLKRVAADIRVRTSLKG